MGKRVKVTEMLAGYEYLLEGKQWHDWDRRCPEITIWHDEGRLVLCTKSGFGGSPCAIDSEFKKDNGYWSTPSQAKNIMWDYQLKDFEVTQVYDYPTYEKVRESTMPNAFYWFRIPNAEHSLSNPNYIPTESEVKELIRKQNEVPWTPGNVKALAGILFFGIFGLSFFSIPPVAGFCGGVCGLLGLYIWSDRWDRRRIKKRGGRCV